MNHIDYIILFVMLIFALIGAYNGCVVSGLGLLSSIFSWITSFIFYPVLSKFIVHHHPNLIKTLIYYTEGASKIQSIEEQVLLVSSLTREQITNIVDRAQLPPPFNRLVLANMLNKALPHLSTVGEYFNYSIAYIILNIVCFIALFLIIRMICQIGISIAKEVFGLPSLKNYDGLAGAVIGILRGMFFVSLLFSLVPVILTLTPVDTIYSLIENSLMGRFFFKSNIFTNLIRGTI